MVVNELLAGHQHSAIVFYLLALGWRLSELAIKRLLGGARGYDCRCLIRTFGAAAWLLEKSVNVLLKLVDQHGLLRCRALSTSAPGVFGLSHGSLRLFSLRCKLTDFSLSLLSVADLFFTLCLVIFLIVRITIAIAFSEAGTTGLIFLMDYSICGLI